MGEYFKSWRRKTSCVTLVMAVVFATAWLRSNYCGDLVLRTRNPVVYLVISANGECKWMAWNQNGKTYPNETHFGLSPSFVMKSFDVSRSSFKNDGLLLHEFAFPYWILAVPLTLQSALLILWPSRRRQSPMGHCDSGTSPAEPNYCA